MTTIPLLNLTLCFVPVCVLVLIMNSWGLGWRRLTVASSRMLVQLISIGYVLTFIFQQDNSIITLCILTIMLIFASWISLSSIPDRRLELLGKSVLSILLGGVPVLFFMTIAVIPSNNWLAPSFIIPLAGMTFSSCMNVIGLCSERLTNELKSNDYVKARRIALKASLIPITNNFLAVGLVSLPGLMTGQILSGVDPLVAVRYQIVIMCMLLCSSGFSSILMLYQLKPKRNLTTL